jgi:signal transduction histidine kinase
MTERGSVFAKLVTTMLTMAASLLLLVTAFFWYVVGPHMNKIVYDLAEEYTRSVVATSPDLETARRLAARLDVQVRYEGPENSWATVDSLPSIGDVRSARVRDSHILVRPKYYVMPAANGGTYLFAWNFQGRLAQAHVSLLVLVLAVIGGIVLTTHMVLTRLLRPLRVLSDGVARVGAGQLDVVLPNGRRDEFGRLTMAFNSMVARVRAMVRARDQLLVDVSHELRSPLTRMKVALELAPNDEQRVRLGGDVGEMERMVAELLELERLRSGRGLTTLRQDLLAVVRDVAAEFRDRPPGVRVVATDRELILDVDAEKFRTVLRNLLENAVKYSLPQSRPVEISVFDEDDAVLIRVTDDGVGIADSDSERVFEPFFRADASRSKSTGGYGLGLSICKRVMEAHGGTIAVERPPGRGASFVLTLPKPATSRS